MRNSKEIKIWMIRKGITQQQIANAVGLRQPIVSLTINAKCNSPKILKWLRDAGCPGKYIGTHDKIQ